ncbi:MAG: hypothetical protein IJW06_03955 [Clostridia bacterium]|nr:hypothetical protein [Clostridia bacterium]
MKFRGEEVTFLGWLDNVWYHFKAGIIIGAFALVILVVGLTQLVTRDEHDVFVYCVGDHGLSAQAIDEFTQEMQNCFAVDANGDGKSVVDLKFDKFVMTEDANGKRKVYNPSEQFSITERFNLELASGECVVYIMEPAFFAGNLDYLASLEEELGYLPEKAVDGKGIRLSDIDSYKATTTLGYFPEDYIICLADREDRFDDAYYDGNVAFFKNLIEYNLVKN